MTQHPYSRAINQAADLICSADTILITAGAGMALPTIRYFDEQQGVPLIRINLREAQRHHHQELASLPLRALDALGSIRDTLSERGFF